MKLFNNNTNDHNDTYDDKIREKKLILEWYLVG